MKVAAAGLTPTFPVIAVVPVLRLLILPELRNCRPTRGRLAIQGGSYCGTATGTVMAANAITRVSATAMPPNVSLLLWLINSI